MKAVIDNGTIQAAMRAYNKADCEERKAAARNNIISLISSENFKINADEMVFLASMDDAEVARHIMSLKGEQYSLNSDESCYYHGVPICGDLYSRFHEGRSGNKTRVKVVVAPDVYRGPLSVLALVAQKGCLHHLSGLLDSVTKFEHWHLHQTLVMLSFFRPENKLTWKLYVDIFNKILKVTNPLEHENLSKLTLHLTIISNNEGKPSEQADQLKQFLSQRYWKPDPRSAVYKIEFKEISAILVAALFINPTALRLLSQHYRPSGMEQGRHITALKIALSYHNAKEIMMPLLTNARLAQWWVPAELGGAISEEKLLDFAGETNVDYDLARDVCAKIVSNAERFVHSDAITFGEEIFYLFSQLLVKMSIPEEILGLITEFLCDYKNNNNYKMTLRNVLQWHSDKMPGSISDLRDSLSETLGCLANQKADALVNECKELIFYHLDIHGKVSSTLIPLYNLLTESKYLIDNLIKAINIIEPLTPARFFMDQLMQVLLNEMSDIIKALNNKVGGCDVKSERKVKAISRHMIDSRLSISRLLPEAEQVIQRISSMIDDWHKVVEGAHPNAKSAVSKKLCTYFKSQIDASFNGADESKQPTDENEVTVESMLQILSIDEPRFKDFALFLLYERSYPLSIINIELSGIASDQLTVLNDIKEILDSLHLSKRVELGNQFYKDIALLKQMLGTIKTSDKAIVSHYEKLVIDHFNLFRDNFTGSASLSSCGGSSLEEIMIDFDEQVSRAQIASPSRGIFACAPTVAGSSAGGGCCLIC